MIAPDSNKPHPMNKRKSLKRRLIVTTVIIVTVTSTLFAGGVMLLKQQLEEATFGKMVTEQIQILRQNPQATAQLAHPLFAKWRYASGPSINALPDTIRSLPPGAYHSIRIEDRHYQLQVAGAGQDKAFLMYDISEWEEQEHKLLLTLAYGILAVMVLALFMATRAASSILTPVRKLTAKLALMHPGQRHLRIADDFNDRDIGQIAAAFDSYSARLDQFVEREQSFTASVSHELRTPLSVMMGAVDVIEANQPSPTSSRALNRIRKACKEMQAFIEATLFLSRETDSGINQSSCADLRKIVLQLLEDNQESISAANVTIETDFQADVELEVAESIVKITVSNLLRNAIEHTSDGTILLQIDNAHFMIRDSGEGIASEDLPHIFDRSFSTKTSGTGLGLNMVKRICDRFGWQLTVDSAVAQGTVVQIVWH